MLERLSRPEGTVAPLSDAVRALRSELTEAMRASASEPLRFRASKITMEFAVEITTSVEAEGGIKFWVVELGANTSRERAATHTVTIDLEPQVADGSSPLIDDAS